MSVILITYDLNSPGQNYEKLVGKIKKFDAWARLSESSYAVRTDLAPTRIFEILKPYVDPNDQIYLINLTRPFAGQGSEEVNKWLADNLP